MNLVYSITRFTTDEEEAVEKVSLVQWKIEGKEDNGDHIGTYTNSIDFFEDPDTILASEATDEALITLVKAWETKNRMERAIRNYILQNP